MTHTRSKYGLGAFLLSVCIVLAFLPVTNTRALELDMTEALVDLLGRTAFDAAGSHKNYNHLLLWDYGSDVNLFVDQDVDGIDHGWVARNITEIMAIFGPNASIRLNVIENPLDAHIVIVSARYKSRLQNRYFYEFLNRRFEFNRRDFFQFTKDMDRLYSDSSYYWAWPQVVNDHETRQKRISGFLAVIEPKKESFRRSFSKTIFNAMGYGNGSFMYSRLNSVQTHADFNTNGIEGIDYSIMYFLYNSQARNGMEKASTLKLFRRWLKSDEFSKLNMNFVKH